MASDFLTGLAGTIEKQFGVGEITDHSLDLAVNGSVQPLGKLGDFAKKIDQSQQRRYVQEGYLRLDPYNVKVKQLEVMMQEPDITVLVKKRAFSSLAENFRLDHLDADEKLFYKASKILFQNKCNQISAVERLSKIARVTTEVGEISKELFPLVLSLVDEIGNGLNGQLDTTTSTDILNGTFTSGFGKLQSVINQVRKVYNYTGNANYTTWLSDTTSPFKSKLGQGTGVIEFTNVMSLSTTCTVGSTVTQANFSISDPYNLMLVTATDIERALSDATNQVYDHKIFQFGQQSSDDMAAELTKQLNQARAKRGASAIEFVVNPDTLLGKRVRAIIEKTGIEINFTYNAAVGLGSLAGGGVTVSIESYAGGIDVGSEGLSPSAGGNSEISLFSRAVENIYNGLQLKQNAGSITSKQNADITNYARRKMQTHYVGRSVIQSMDQVHIYISSKAKLDTKILGGLQSAFSGLGFLQNLNNASGDIQNQFESLFNPNANANFQIEKSVIVGSDFPNWLWTILRTQFVNDTGGAHVFAGIVSQPSREYSASSGSYVVNVPVENNLKYLKLGKVNFKPSVDVFNGPFFDPLTPFKTSTDSISGSFKKETPILLEENKELLSYNVIKFKSGPNKGKPVTEELLLNDRDKETEALGDTRQIYYCPDGFTYRWKEGIGTLVQFSSAGGLLNPNSTGTPPNSKDPFAGQDVMNVISLAITGIPYNYATFVKAARQINGYTRDVQSGANGAHSYYQSLTNDLSKNNALWGNFIPFKNLVMDEASFEQVLKAQTTITNVNDQIGRNLAEARELTETLQFLTGAKKTTTDVNVAQRTTMDALQKVQTKLDTLYTEVYNQLKLSTSQSLSIVGNDVAYDFDEYINNDAKNGESLTNPNIRREVRRKQNFLTRKLSWQVRANEDKNFLIVDDSYDKDYDLMAYEQELSGEMQTFNSEYSDVMDKVVNSAQILDLEVYCDTQGHIRVRPPQYNKVPSSVFYRMFQLKQQTGIQIFPQFLEDLFVTQIQTLVKNISIIEDQIRLDAAALGKNTDKDVYELLRGSSSGATFSDSIFNFVTDENGKGQVSNFQGIIDNANPDVLTSEQSQTFLEQLQAQAGSKRAFNTVIRAKFLTSSTDPIPASVTNSSRVSDLIARLHMKTGQQVSLDNFLIKAVDGTVSSAANSPKNQVDAFKVANDIADKVSQRQKLIKLAANALKNAQEYISLDNDKSAPNKILFPNLTNNSNVPEVFASMIEDESYDDLGPGSGQRYVVKDYQIKSYNITEGAPEYTTVDVKGSFNTFASNSGVPSELNNSITGNGGGNALISASAIDYDMWRMYGFRGTHAFSAPFLKNPQTQCAPYAAMILSRARKNILQGTLTIAGNEFMQPGEVIYLESSDLLFYVQQVQHQFAYGNTFNTTLTLTYGHTVGDYIPTTLDLIGKLIYNNRDNTQFVNYRQNGTANEQHLGTIVLDTRASDDIENDRLLGGTFGTQNISVINNIKSVTQQALSMNQDPNTTVKAKIELRLFYQGDLNSNLLDAATLVFDYLTANSSNNLLNTNITLNIDDVAVFPVDVAASGEYRSPSQKAVDMVRNVQDLISSSNFTNTLFSYIIDCWITFDQN